MTSPSAAVKNEFATALIASQNDGSEHLRCLPPTVAADFKAIVVRSAARAIAGLPIFENGPLNQQLQARPHLNTVTAFIAPMTTKIAYDNTAKTSLLVPAQNTSLAPKIHSKKCRNRANLPKIDTRVIVHFLTNHPLRLQDTLLVLYKLGGLLD